MGQPETVRNNKSGDNMMKSRVIFRCKFSDESAIFSLNNVSSFNDLCEVIRSKFLGISTTDFTVKYVLPGSEPCVLVCDDDKGFMFAFIQIVMVEHVELIIQLTEGSSVLRTDRHIEYWHKPDYDLLRCPIIMIFTSRFQHVVNGFLARILNPVNSEARHRHVLPTCQMDADFILIRLKQRQKIDVLDLILNINGQR
ncbi:hypothetical protein LguiA_007713 [Lonicera macranthoides]